jgi:hypothetical protein
MSIPLFTKKAFKLSKFAGFFYAERQGLAEVIPLGGASIQMLVAVAPPAFFVLGLAGVRHSARPKTKNAALRAAFDLAERQGFEPWIPLQV